MKEQIEGRLQQLKRELGSGQEVLSELKTKQANVRDTLLRIQGAIQVLEEELARTENVLTAEDALPDHGPVMSFNHSENLNSVGAIAES